MKNLLLVCALLCSFQLMTQNVTDTIETRKALGVVFLQNGKPLTPRQLLEITSVNSEAFQEMQRAKSNFDAGSVLGFVGGFMVGWPIGTAIGGGKPVWAMAGIGAGILALSIPLSVGYSKHAKNAVRIYNNSLHPTSMIRNKTEFNLCLDGNGIGIRMNF
jgi:outer membrane lipoprotein SlyB